MKRSIQHVVAASALALPISTYAATDWADWTIPTHSGTQPWDTPDANYPYVTTDSSNYSTYRDGITGSVLDPNNSNASVSVTLTGEVLAFSKDNATDWINGENTSDAYDDGRVASPVNEDRYAQTGYTLQQYKAHTITFGNAVDGVVMAVWSLGQSSDAASMLFSEDFEIIDTENTGGLTKTVTSQGYMLTGSGTAGIIQFYSNSLTSITYTVTDPEIYAGVTFGLTDNTTLSGTGGATITIDQSAPTLTSSSPSDDEVGVAPDANITLTFNENIVDNGGTIKLYKADGTLIETFSSFTVSGATITLDPSNNLEVGESYYIQISSSAVKDTTGNLYTGISDTTTLNFSVGGDPTTKADVVGGIQASMNSAKAAAKASIRSIEMRMEWLRRNKDSANKSVQGVNVAFADPLLNQFVNGDPRALEAFKLASAQDVLQNYGQNPDQVMSDVQNVPIEIAMAEAQKAFGKVDLNPTGGKVIGDWFMWTAGQVTIGKSKNSSSSVTNESEALNLAIGMDKSDADSMFGFAVNGSKDMTDIGTDGSKQKSYGASVSIYGGFDTDALPPVELILGVGHMNISSTRIDGSQTLTGSRDARTVFGSVGVLAEAIEKGKATITPYSKLEAAYIDLGSFSETGGSLALAYDNQIVKQAMLKVGLDADYETEWMNGKLVPFTRLEYAYDFSPSSNADMHYVGDSTNYRLTTDKNAVSNWTMRLGGDYAHNSGASTSVFYERTESINSGHSDSIQLKVSIPF